LYHQIAQLSADLLRSAVFSCFLRYSCNCSVPYLAGLGEDVRFLCDCLLGLDATHAILAQGVVVQPALAIPYFTGVSAFIGNIISLSSKLESWQQTVISKVLQELPSYLDQILNSDLVGDVLKKLETLIQDQVYFKSAGMSPHMVELVKQKLKLLNLKRRESGNKPKLNASSSNSAIPFRKLSEAEIVVLSKSLWPSIR
jgi:hypothetical protein